MKQTRQELTRGRHINTTSYVLLCLSLQIGCVSEGETELNPNKTWVFCGRDGPSLSNSEDQLIFYDCQTLNISIRSYSWNYRTALPYTVLRASMSQYEYLVGPILSNV